MLSSIPAVNQTEASEFGEFFPAYTDQIEHVRAMNAEARKLAEFGAILDVIGFPRDRMEGFVEAMNANARMIGRGPTDEQLASMAAAHAAVRRDVAR